MPPDPDIPEHLPADAGDSERPAPSLSYEVGYKKPPQHTRFKKGQSGNNKGRPKRSKNMRTLLMQELGQTVELSENGETRKVTKAEAAVKRLLLNAMKGDMRALLTLFKLTADDPDASPEEQAGIKTIEKEILASFAKRFSDETKPEGTDQPPEITIKDTDYDI